MTSYLSQNPRIGVVFSAITLLVLSAPNANSNQAHPDSVSVRTPVVYYVDCSTGQDGKGTQSLPWKSLSDVSALALHPGDRLLFKRGTQCAGSLTPQGSGAANAPIFIDAYGTGTPPVINGGNAEEAVKLFNQQYWEINNLEITGGNRYGLYISGDTPKSSLNHIHLRNLNVHSATFNSTKRADSGEVFVSPRGAAEILNDVVVDGVIAHDSHVSEGIFVSAGGAWIETDSFSQPLGSNVTVQNSIAHDIYGDGILISELTNGLLQKNVVYRSGLCPDCTGSTPVGLWEWYCHTCTVQYNESYANESWDGDGGDFDIDYYNDNNVVQYNYGHDSAGYCVAFFGAGGRATHDSVFRYNVCSHDGQRSDLSKQGEVFIHTWNGGSLDGVEIYNNTFYWDPASSAAALSVSDATFSGNGPLFFKNNIIYATVPGMTQTISKLALDHNVYWTTAASAPTWRVDGTTYASISAYQAATKQDLHSYYADPMLNRPTYHGIGTPTTAFQLLPKSPAVHTGTDVCNEVSGCSMGTQDFWGYHRPATSVHNIGAYEGP